MGGIAKRICQCVEKPVISFLIDSNQSPVIIGSLQHTKSIPRINKRLHILPASPGIYHPVLFVRKAIYRATEYLLPIYGQDYRMHTITVVYTVHIIIRFDTGSDYAPCFDRAAIIIQRKSLVLLYSFHYSPTRLGKQHYTFCLRRSSILDMLQKKRHRINIITRRGLKHIQM